MFTDTHMGRLADVHTHFRWLTMPGTGSKRPHLFTMCLVCKIWIGTAHFLFQIKTLEWIQFSSRDNPCPEPNLVARSRCLNHPAVPAVSRQQGPVAHIPLVEESAGNKLWFNQFNYCSFIYLTLKPSWTHTSKVPSSLLVTNHARLIPSPHLDCVLKEDCDWSPNGRPREGDTGRMGAEWEEEEIGGKRKTRK